MQHKHCCVSLFTSKFKYKPSILIVYYTRNRPMSLSYWNRSPSRDHFGQVRHVTYFSHLHKKPILFWHIILCTIYIWVSLFLLAPLFVRYLSLGHPRVSKVWSDENSTKMFFLYLKTYAKNSKIQKKKITGSYRWFFTSMSTLFIH